MRWLLTRLFTRARGGNCINEQNMAREIEQLENLVEELGGDTRLCLERGRAMAGEKEK